MEGVVGRIAGRAVALEPIEGRAAGREPPRGLAASTAKAKAVRAVKATSVFFMIKLLSIFRCFGLVCHFASLFGVNCAV
jgi:hypothetical protein